MTGSIDTEILYNVFEGHLGGFEEAMRVNASDIFNFMPQNYFAYSHAPIIRIDMLLGVETLDNENVYKLNMESNLFQHNRNYQIVTTKVISYYGSLVELHCEMPVFKLEF